MTQIGRFAQDRYPAPWQPSEALRAVDVLAAVSGRSGRSGPLWRVLAGGLAMAKRMVDPETAAIVRVLAILATLDPKARERVLRYVLARVAEDAGNTTVARDADV